MNFRKRSKPGLNPAHLLDDVWPGCTLRVLEDESLIRYRVEHVDSHLGLLEGFILDESGHPTSRFVMSFARWKKLSKKR